MDSKLTKQVTALGANEKSLSALRNKRTEILDRIDAAERSGEPMLENELRGLLGELFDLNIAIGDAGFEKDGDR